MSENQSERLRNWYLARLRRRALERNTASQLTPAALITADRQMVEELIAEKSKVQRTGATANPLFTVYIWLIGTLALGAIVFLSESFDLKRTIAGMYAFTVGLMNGSVPAAGEFPFYMWVLPVFFWGWPVVWFCLIPLWQRSKNSTRIGR